MPSPRPPVATVTDLNHRYGKVCALDALTAEIPSGCMVGLIGPDGVGKSTLLGLIAGVRKIQTGEVRALDGDLKDASFRQGAYARIDNGELFVHKMYIGPYKQATSFAHEPKRSRKLLAHRSEIERWTGKLAVRGYTLVPVQVYFKNGRAKIELGLAKAKDMEDKREDLKRKVELREAKEAMGKGRRR